ncbi:isochorismatase domain-containing protein 1 isoform X2 [Mustelus asterias]
MAEAQVPVLFCFSTFSRASTVPLGSGHEVLIQKFLALYGGLIGVHRKFLIQLHSAEWGEYIDLPKGFVVNERCKLRLVSLQVPLQGAHILGIPVIVTEQYPKGLGSTVAEIDVTTAKMVVPKTKFSMVVPEVENALNEMPGVQSVVLFGVETHVCIQQTALDLIGRGLEVHIIADATSSRSMMDRMFALERLARAGIIITTSEAVLLQLVADKDHPHFKEVQNLIKASAPESGLLSKV